MQKKRERIVSMTLDPAKPRPLTRKQAAELEGIKAELANVRAVADSAKEAANRATQLEAENKLLATKLEDAKKGIVRARKPIQANINAPAGEGPPPAAAPAGPPRE